MKINKSELLIEFREYADFNYKQICSDIPNSKYKDRAKKINKCIQNYKNSIINKLNTKDKELLLEQMLMLNYVSYVMMLEYRNKCWNYDYMAFSRRIGEIWEPFCKLPFNYPITDIKVIKPKKFIDVQHNLENEIKDYINKLNLDDKRTLFKYYSKVWKFIDSGSVNLALDLHFEKDGIKYNVDYKSGFSSNEKGNVNRLLMVGSIYDSLNNNYTNMIFVRQKEDQNNNYLRRLKNSPYWNVYCFDETYKKIKDFTNFDLLEWMNNNMRWSEDISDDFKKYLIENDLLKYLTW